MRWLLNVAKAMLLLLVLLAGIGLLLPRVLHVERQLIIQAPQELIWQSIADPQRWNAWSPWYTREPATQVTLASSVIGAGASWSWMTPAVGSGRMHLTNATSPQQVDYELQLDPSPGWTTRSTGTFRLEKVNIGVRVTWLQDTDLGWNPALRWFGLEMGRTQRTDFDEGLLRLSLITTPR